MNNIQLNIIANAQFQQVYAEVAKLKEAMLSLQKASVGGPFTPANVAGIKSAQQAFDHAVLSTRAFNIESVAMTSNVEKFGKQLQAGKLSLSNYYKIWRDSARGTSAELDKLATSQARLNRSIAIADPLRPGYAKLVTDINGVVTAQEKQLFYQKALNTALQQGSIKLIDFGKNTQWMGRQLTVGLTMPLAMFGAGVSSTFISVDKELTRMQKVYGTGLVQPTQAALKQIRADVQALGTELAKTLGTSVQETSAMAADLAATGLEGTKLLGATREAIRLSTLGELDHQQAMQATVSLQNVYKLSTQGLTEAVNFLNAVENQTSTSLQDLVDAIPRVGPIVQQLGGTFKDTAAMMVAMKEAGVPAAQGANAIKSALSSLINPTKSAKDAFAAYNINIASIAKSTGGSPIAMLKALADQMKDLDRLAQAQLIEKMFGKYQYARIQALLDNINKVGSQTQTVFNLMGASTQDLATLASNELKQQTESASGKFKRMVETVKADLLPLGNMFLESFTRIGNIVDKIASAFKTLSHAMGPAAKIFGTIFGGGLAGLVIVGPIIMLVGLFANLIGNILRGANAMRMFKQGMDSASGSENKFLAGLHGMRNFYEDLDKGMIAARNQMDLMPDAITSNARAFEVLSIEIDKLTRQFIAFGEAQAASMGIPMVAKNPLLGQAKLPGFASGGLVPGSGNGDSVFAMLTPGEFVVNKKSTQQFGSAINAINNGSIPGFNNGGPVLGHMAANFEPGSSEFESVLNSKTGFRRFSQMGGIFRVMSNLTARMSHQLNSLLREGSATTEQFLSGFDAGGPLKFGESAIKGGMKLSRLRDPQIQSAMTQFEEELKKRVVALNKQTLSDNDIYAVTKTLIQDFKANGAAAEELMVALENSSKSVGGFRAFLDKARVKAEVELGNIERVVSSTSKYPHPTGVLRVDGTTVGEFGGSRGPGGIGDISRNRYGLSKAAQIQLDEIRNEYKAYAGIASPSEMFSNEVGKPISQGIAKGIAEATPVVKTAASKMLQATQMELDLGVPKVGTVIKEDFMKSIWIPLEEEAIVAGHSTGKSVITGIEEEVNSGLSRNRLSNIKNKIGNMGMMGRFGFGMGAMMVGSMAGNAIGGSTGQAISNVSNYASMGMMFGGPGAAIGAALGGLVSVIQIAATKVRESSNLLQGSFGITAQAAQAFGINFRPLGVYDFSSVTSNVKKHVDSINSNRTAVDNLTAAYKNATDQLTTDLLNKIKGQSKGDLLKTMNESYASVMAAGGTEKQAMQDVTAKMLAAGKNAADIKYVQTHLTKPENVEQALNKLITYATDNLSKDQKNLLKTDPAYKLAYDRLNTPGTGLYALRDQQIQTNKDYANLWTPQVKKKNQERLNNLNTEIFAQEQKLNPKSSTGILSKATIDALTTQLNRLALGPVKNLTESFKSMNGNVINNKEVIKSLANEFAKSWPDFDQFAGKLEKAGGKTKQLTEVIALLTTGVVTQDVVMKTLAKDGIAGIDKLYSDLKDKIAEIQKTTNTNTGGGTTVDHTKEYNPLIKHLTSVRKLIQAQADAQKKYNDQLKATQDYHQKQMDFFNNMKGAFTSGNYLQAALFKQGAQANQAEFAGSLKEQANQDKLARLDSLLASAQEGQNSGDSFKKWAKANPGIAKLVDSKYDKQLLGGITASTMTKNTTAIANKAEAIISKANSEVASGAFGGLTVNVYADNSVVPTDFAKSVAQQVISQQSKIAASRNTSNKAGTMPRSSRGG